MMSGFYLIFWRMLNLYEVQGNIIGVLFYNTLCPTGKAMKKIILYVDELSNLNLPRRGLSIVER